MMIVQFKRELPVKRDRPSGRLSWGELMVWVEDGFVSPPLGEIKLAAAIQRHGEASVTRRKALGVRRRGWQVQVWRVRPCVRQVQTLGQRQRQCGVAFAGKLYKLG